jgi:hypothetical protein
MRAQTRESDRVSERSGAKLAGVNQSVVLEVSDQKGAQPFSHPLWVCKAADHELLRRPAFHLQPMRRSAVLVR